MRIGIDAHVLGKGVGGVERFVRELVDRLPGLSEAHDYIIFVTKAEWARLKNSTVPDHVQYYPLAVANPLLERLILLPYLARKHRLDALMVQRLAPWFCGRCRLVTTIHDLTPIKFSQDYRGVSNFLVKVLTKNTIKRSHLILTPTNTIASEIKDYYPQTDAPIVAFYNGVSTERFKQSIGSDMQHQYGRYILTVGAIEKRKNIETLISMMSNMQDDAALKLVIVGGVRDQQYFNQLQQQWQQLGLNDRVIYHGFIDEQALISLYQHAALFVTASRDEGFNLPPLEAMACGVPVACSDIKVHQELFAGGATFFPADDAQALFAAVNAVLSNSETTQQNTAKAYRIVQKFNWENTAKNVANAFLQIK